MSAAASVFVPKSRLCYWICFTAIRMELASHAQTTQGIDEEIEHVWKEIKRKDALIRQLNDEKAELAIRYEELKAARLRSQSLALASERDWEKGKSLFALTPLAHEPNNIGGNHLQTRSVGRQKWPTHSMKFFICKSSVHSNYKRLIVFYLRKMFCSLLPQVRQWCLFTRLTIIL